MTESTSADVGKTCLLGSNTPMDTHSYKPLAVPSAVPPTKKHMVKKAKGLPLANHPCSRHACSSRCGADAFSAASTLLGAEAASAGCHSAPRCSRSPAKGRSPGALRPAVPSRRPRGKPRGTLHAEGTQTCASRQFIHRGVSAPGVPRWEAVAQRQPQAATMHGPTVWVGLCESRSCTASPWQQTRLHLSLQHASSSTHKV
eukprot:364915-Chlamydomonas_euryale.AAC.4